MTEKAVFMNMVYLLMPMCTAIVINAFLLKRAKEELDLSEKAKLKAMNNKVDQYFLACFFCILLLNYIFKRYPIFSDYSLSNLYYSSLVILILGIGFIKQRTLKKHNFSPRYTKAKILTNFITSGAIFLVVILAKWVLKM